MPIDYKEYPPNWKSEIRPQIMKRAGEVREGDIIIQQAKCEQCGVLNKSHGYRDKDGNFIDWQTIEDALDKTGYDYFDDELKHQIRPNGFAKKMTVIVLTVAHLDHDKENQNISIDRLKALCQRCHLNYDKERHNKSRRDNLNKRKGVISLFEE